MPGLLSQGFRVEGVFQDIQEATACFAAAINSENKETREGASTDTTMGAGVSVEPDEHEIHECAVALINCLGYYRSAPLLQRGPDAELLRMITELRDTKEGLGIRLLMPEGKNTDQDLLIDLMSRGFLDFWFVTAINSTLLSEILLTRRSFRDMEAYLATLPPPGIPSQAEKKRDFLSGLLKSLPTVEKVLGKWKNKGIELEPGVSQIQEHGLEIGQTMKLEPEPGQTPTSNSMNGSESDRSFRLGSVSDKEGYGDINNGAADGAQGSTASHVPQSSNSVRVPWEVPEAVDYAMDFRAAARKALGKMGAFLGHGFVENKAKHSAKGTSSGKTRVVSMSAGAVRMKSVALPLGLEDTPTKPRFGSVHKLPGRARIKKSAPDPAFTHDSLLFYSEEDCVLAYALAFLTAGYLASQGSKTLLVELPGSGSKLAVTLGLRHMDKNLPGALREYAFGERREWRNHCFNGPELFHDPRAIDRTSYSRRMPKSLYFLPDSDADRSLYPYWDGFLASLIHWAVMAEHFSYIIYVGFGGGDDLCWKKGLVCSHKVILFQPWANGFNEAMALERNWQKGCVPAFDGSWGMKYIGKEVKDMKLQKHLVIPNAIKNDFMGMAAFEREAEDISPESLQCLKALWACLSA